jgi:hypothetical protein
MPTTHAKLYSTLSGWTTAKDNLETQLGLPKDGFLRYCGMEQVRSDHPKHANKYILPIMTDPTGTFDTRSLVTGEMVYDPDWTTDPPEE